MLTKILNRKTLESNSRLSPFKMAFPNIFYFPLVMSEECTPKNHRAVSFLYPFLHVFCLYSPHDATTKNPIFVGSKALAYMKPRLAGPPFGHHLNDNFEKIVRRHFQRVILSDIWTNFFILLQCRSTIGRPEQRSSISKRRQKYFRQKLITKKMVMNLKIECFGDKSTKLISLGDKKWKKD